MTVKTIVVVEDEEAILNLYGDLLSIHGYSTKLFLNGHTALEDIQKTKFDLLITDFILGNGMDGIDLIIKSKNFVRNSPIVITGNIEIAKEKARKNGVGELFFFAKPVRFKQVISTIRSFT